MKWFIDWVRQVLSSLTYGWENWGGVGHLGKRQPHKLGVEPLESRWMLDGDEPEFPIVNMPPNAHDDYYSVEAGSPVAGNVLANDTDPDGDALTAQLFNLPNHGWVVLQSNGDFIYQSDSSHSGYDSFSYKALDGQGGESTVTNVGLYITNSGDTIGTDTIGTDTIGTDTIGTDTIGTDTIGTDTIGTDTIGTDTIGTDTIGTDTIGTDTIGTDTIGTDTIGTDTIGTDTIGTDTIGTDTIGTDTIGTDTIGTDTIGTDTIGTDTIGTDTIGTDTIGTDTIGTDTIGTDTIGTDTIGTDTIGTDTIGTDTIGTDTIGTDTIGTDTIGTDTIGTDTIGTDTIGTDTIGTDTIGTDTIGTDTIGTDTIGTDTIGTDTIGTDTIGTDTIGTDTIGTDTIGTDTIGTDTIGTDTIGTDTIGTDTIGTDTIGTDTIGTDTIGTDTIGTDTIGSDTPVFDFGDAPDSYHTTLANNGARHLRLAGGNMPWLGKLIDFEMNGQPTDDATGDDRRDPTVLSILDDEDGVVLPHVLLQDTEELVTVVVSGQAGFLDGWIDFNGSGTFDETDGEHIIDSVWVAVGAKTFAFDVPATATLNKTFARFRISGANDLAASGPANGGEVEDYGVEIVASDYTPPCGVTAVDDFAETDPRTPIEYIDALLNDQPLPQHPLADFSYTATHVASGDSGITIFDDYGPLGTMYALRDQGQGQIVGACANLDFEFGGLTAASYVFDSVTETGTALYLGGSMQVFYNGVLVAEGNDLMQTTVYDFDPDSPTYMEAVVTRTVTLEEVGENRFYEGEHLTAFIDFDPVTAINNGVVTVASDGPGWSRAYTGPEDLLITNVDSPPSGATATDADFDADGIEEIRYTPNSTFNGIDEFDYTIAGPFGGTDTRLVTVTIQNQLPVAIDDTGTLISGVAVINVLGNDTDPDGDTLSIVGFQSSSMYGTIAMNASGNLVYTETACVFLNDVFTYTIDDGHGGMATATVTVSAEPNNNAPIAVPDTGIVQIGNSVVFDLTANDSDPDGDTISLNTVDITSQYFGAIADNGDGTVVYTAPTGFVGFDLFSYVIEDEYGLTSGASVVVRVIPVNSAPLAENDQVTTGVGEGAVVSVLLNDSDPDGDVFWITSFDTISTNGGTIIDDGTSLIYFPPHGFTGDDSFDYAIVDVNGGTAATTVSVNVNGASNDAPIAIDDNYFLADTGVLNVDVASGLLNNDLGSGLSVVLVSGPLDGTLALNGDGSFQYTPGPTFSGNNSFTYIVASGGISSNVATVTIGGVVITNWNVDRKDWDSIDNEIWVDVPSNGWTWEGDQLRWTATVLPGEPDIQIDGIEWQKKPWDDLANASVSWETFTSSNCDCPANGDPGIGYWAIQPVVHFTDSFLQPGSTSGAAKPLGHARIVSVEWEGINPGDGKTNLFDNPADMGGGKKIVPDRNTRKGPSHDRVNVVVKVAPTQAVGQNVYLLAIDADDPSAFQAPIDEDWDGSDYVVTDNQGDLPDGWADVRAVTTVNRPDDEYDGPVAVASFTGTPYPGNNYRIVTSGRNLTFSTEFLKPLVGTGNGAETQGRVFYSKDRDNLLESDEGEGIITEVGVDPDDGGRAPKMHTSPLLTVWRRYNVEVDSMGAPALGVDYGFDDEDPDPEGPIPRPDISELAASFRPAFIEISVLPDVVVSLDDPPLGPYASEEDPSQVDLDFRKDFGTVEFAPLSATVVEAEKYILTGHQDYNGGKPSRQSLDGSLYWTIYILAAYEGATDTDNDPNDTKRIGGYGPANQYAMIFTEVVRDLAAQKGWSAEQRQHVDAMIPVHEIGHQVGLVHPPKNTADEFGQHVMAGPRTDAKDWTGMPTNFKAEDIKKIRSRNN